jgi:amidase
MNSMEGQDSVASVLGPLSNSIGGLKSFMRAVAGQKPWLQDALAVRKPWNDDEYALVDHGYGKSLCFAILWNDGVLHPHPPIIRGLEMVKCALVAAGHKGLSSRTSPYVLLSTLSIVIDWKPLKHKEMNQCLVILFPPLRPNQTHAQKNRTEYGDLALRKTTKRSHWYQGNHFLKL